MDCIVLSPNVCLLRSPDRKRHHRVKKRPSSSARRATSIFGCLPFPI
ncbi:hypothetical protein HMPREF3036_00344 [Sutterella sp. KLE1602]|nr:hypothetical protein HMPREF3036_00344 [Sutterella sp. KLE1602]